MKKPILSNEKKTIQQKAADGSLAAERLIAEFRERDWSPEEITEQLASLAEGEPAWRGELLYLLAHANGVPTTDLYRVCEVGPATVMQRRRKDPVLDQAVVDYLGAFFEDEAQLPIRDIKAGVLTAGLEAHAHGWKPNEGRSLSDEDLQRIIRAIVDSVRLRVGDPAILKLIGEDIQATLRRHQGS